jgi:GNAT superfamily N-acetyltransferase
VIRPARREDARTLAELEVRAWRWAYVDIVDERDMPTVADREARWRERPLDGAFVWDQDGRVVGVVQTGPRHDEPGVGALRGLYVDPAAQGAGVGTALHDHAVERLGAAGFREATLWVFTANGQARDFYAARGWAPDGAERVSEAPELRYRLTPAGDEG